MYRILVVDDEPHIRMGIAEKIQQLDIGCVVSGYAANGQEALRWLTDNYVDICITDIRMPIMDGLDLVRQLKQTGSPIVNIIVSSYDDFTFAKQAIELNVSNYILKPVDRYDLKKSLEEAVSTIEVKRRNEANQLLVQKMGHYDDMIARWEDFVLTKQTDKYPMLVVETLNLLESWIDKEYVMLDALSIVWIMMIEKELSIQANDYAVWPDQELGLEFHSSGLTRDQLRYYFRLCAVMRLEKSISYFYEQINTNNKHENRKLINTVKQYIDLHYAEKLNVIELANRIPVSRSYLTVLFKQVTGQTIWNYVVGVRMKSAKMMLLDHQLKTYEIADKVGYKNSEHFTKVFKDYFGITPKDYRRMMEMNTDET